MWKFAIFVAIFAFGAYAYEDLTPFVRGGREANVGEYAADVSIETPDPLRCQGVMIDDRHALTAASCVINGTDRTIYHSAWFRVIAGDRDLFVPSSSREVRAVTHIYPHDQYNPLTHANDLAVIRLESAIPIPHVNIEAAIFNDRIVPAGTQCHFSGWGTATNLTTSLQQIKRVIIAPIVASQTCNGVTFGHPGRVMDTMLCAGTLTPGTGGEVDNAVCRGNPGGGLYCDGNLTGILSFGLGCGAVNHPGIYTQVRMMATWINQQPQRTDTIPLNTQFPRA